MKSVLISLIFVLSFCVAAFSQTNENSPCPTISVRGQAGIPEPNEPVTFVASIGEENKEFDLKYNWTVSSGEIIEGQGTLTVKILQKDLGESFTATLEVIGLPKRCRNTVSETTYINIVLDPVQFDQFSISISRIDKARLENLGIEINKNPSAKAYIIEHFEKKVSREAIARKNKATVNYLKRIGIGTDRFALLNALTDTNLTQFFIVPAGATPPICEDCVTVELK